jgi:hypothetical protein
MNQPKFNIGDKVKHFAYGKGVILGNYHKRAGSYYWHIQYENDSFGYNQESNLKLLNNSIKPYLEEVVTEIVRNYNPNYGDDRICKCGHPYYRHFDTYENMSTCGCKYCGCFTFEEENN